MPKTYKTMKQIEKKLELIPEKLYSVLEASNYLGIHRCTIYSYIGNTKKPLPYIQVPNKVKILFLGKDLIAYKAAGLPRRGRKKNTES